MEFEDLAKELRGIAEVIDSDADRAIVRDAAAVIENIEAMKDGFLQRLMASERQAASHGAIQARREVQEYLRSKGHQMLAQDVVEFCHWGQHQCP